MPSQTTVAKEDMKAFCEIFKLLHDDVGRAMVVYRTKGLACNTLKLRLRSASISSKHGVSEFPSRNGTFACSMWPNGLAGSSSFLCGERAHLGLGSGSIRERWETESLEQATTGASLNFFDFLALWQLWHFRTLIEYFRLQTLDIVSAGPGYDLQVVTSPSTGWCPVTRAPPGTG